MEGGGGGASFLGASVANIFPLSLWEQVHASPHNTMCLFAFVKLGLRCECSEHWPGQLVPRRDTSDGRVTARDALQVTCNMSHRVAWSRSREEDWCHEARNNVCDVSRVMCDVKL